MPPGVLPTPRGTGTRRLDLRGPQGFGLVCSGLSRLPTGHPELDVRLPGGGWPLRALTELSALRHGAAEMSLLAPCLQALQRAGRLLMFFDAPAALSAACLVQQGLDPVQLLRVETTCLQDDASGRSARSRLWAMEQVLRSGQVGAVVAWLPPQATRGDLLRLQRAARSHDGPVFVWHHLAPSVYPGARGLRLLLRDKAGQGLAVQVQAEGCAPPRAGPRVPGLTRRAVPRRGGSAGRSAPYGASVDIRPLPGASGPALAEPCPPSRPAATFVNLG